MESCGDFPAGRLDFIFFTNSVMSVDKSFIISTENMEPLLYYRRIIYLLMIQTHRITLPVIVDFILPINTTGFYDDKSDKETTRIIDLFGRDIEKKHPSLLHL